MAFLRSHLLRHRRLALCILIAAWLMKMLVPTGYMLGTVGGAVTIELCRGYGPQTAPVTMSGMAGHGGRKEGHGTAKHGGPELPCAFAGLVAPAMAGADPILIAIAVAFIMAATFRLPAPGGTSAPAFLRPPTRGPPATP